MTILVDGIPKEFDTAEAVDSHAGFIVAPFKNIGNKLVVLSGFGPMQGWEIETPSYPGTAHVEKPTSPTPFIIGKEDYQAQVNAVRKQILAGNAEKVVLSRIRPYHGLGLETLPELFSELIVRYPQAFVYLVHSGTTGTWIGASPETLVRIEPDRFTTMALAGTREYEGFDGPVDWTEKEIREQAHVLRYIQKKLAAAGYAFQESSIQTIRAGNVVHLRSMFSGGLKNGPNDWKELVRVLFPTPAVCGTEAAAAMEIIQSIEPHSREYYSGFLGPFGDTGNTDIFVNLRCMKVVDDVAYLYAGGGILGESDPLKEWEETELKFKTLTDAIDSVKQVNS